MEGKLTLWRRGKKKEGEEEYKKNDIKREQEMSESIGRREKEEEQRGLGTGAWQRRVSTLLPRVKH